MYKLMKIIDGFAFEWGEYESVDRAAKAAFNLGRNASVVDDVEIVTNEDNNTAKWVREPAYPDTEVSLYQYECTNCKAKHRAIYDYCPSCGSKMDYEGD